MASDTLITKHVLPPFSKNPFTESFRYPGNIKRLLVALFGVAAGALADHGDLQGAVRLMHHGSQDPRKVQEYHLREWYMLGDLYDRSGDVIAARKMFGRIAAHDPHFSDVSERLSTLGT